MKELAEQLAKAWPERFRFYEYRAGDWCISDNNRAPVSGITLPGDPLTGYEYNSAETEARVWAFWGTLAEELGVGPSDITREDATGCLQWNYTKDENDIIRRCSGPLESLAAAVLAKAKDRNPAGEGEKSG